MDFGVAFRKLDDESPQHSGSVGLEVAEMECVFPDAEVVSLLPDEIPHVAEGAFERGDTKVITLP